MDVLQSRARVKRGVGYNQAHHWLRPGALLYTVRRVDDGVHLKGWQPASTTSTSAAGKGLLPIAGFHSQPTRRQAFLGLLESHMKFT